MAANHLWPFTHIWDTWLSTCTNALYRWVLTFLSSVGFCLSSWTVVFEVLENKDATNWWPRQRRHASGSSRYQILGGAAPFSTNCSSHLYTIKWIFTTTHSNVYGGQLWANYHKPMHKRMAVAYNDIYRGLFNIQRGESISAIYVSNRIDSFCTVLRKLVYSFKSRTSASCNSLVSAVICSPDFVNSKLHAEWQKILYL